MTPEKIQYTINFHATHEETTGRSFLPQPQLFAEELRAAFRSLR